MGGLDDQFRQGVFEPVVSWLGKKIHSQGSRWTTDELMERATGAPLSAHAFLGHVKRRYLEGER